MSKKPSYKNPIWVAGQIDNKEFYANFTRRFSEVMSQTKRGDVITVFINSPGGETNTALGIFDLLEKTDRQTVGIVTGIAYSGASLILQACKRRIVSPNSRLMLHKSTVKVGGSVENAQEALNTFKKLDNKFYEIYSAKTGKTLEEISKIATKDRYFDAQEAVKFGLADEVLV